MFIVEFPNVTSTLIDVETYKNQIIEALNIDELDAPERYAIVSQLADAFNAARQVISNDAIIFCLASDECQPDAGNGKEFKYKGLYFSITYKYQYAYGSQRIDGKLDPNSAKWLEMVAQVHALAKSQSAANDARKGYQALILAAHPRMVPTDTETIFSFHKDKTKRK